MIGQIKMNRMLMMKLDEYALPLCTWIEKGNWLMEGSASALMASV